MCMININAREAKSNNLVIGYSFCECEPLGPSFEACSAAIVSSAAVGFDSEADVLPYSAQFDRARTSGLACNHSAGPRTSDPGKHTFH
ncbi:hypothetical protein V6N13_055167 [Hibiscus sabdariffa]|uniref:Uncharacterized protein n=1 Tax=Hibiscus sabdariffa TaxID=183260 RepID=A0ABR2P882_9ROSI